MYDSDDSRHGGGGARDDWVFRMKQLDQFPSYLLPLTGAILAQLLRWPDYYALILLILAVGLHSGQAYLQYRRDKDWQALLETVNTIEQRLQAQAALLVKQKVDAFQGFDHR